MDEENVNWDTSILCQDDTGKILKQTKNISSHFTTLDFSRQYVNIVPGKRGTMASVLQE